MSNRTPLHDFLTPEQRQACLDAIIDHFADERDEQIGIIAAENILDLVLEPISKAAYNKGLADARKLMDDRISNLNLDIDLLKK